VSIEIAKLKDCLGGMASPKDYKIERLEMTDRKV
jgi:hypothetical protein